MPVRPATALALILLLSLLHGGMARAGAPVAEGYRLLFAGEVDRRLRPPVDVREDYALGLHSALLAELGRERIDALDPQFFVLVDRSPQVQAAMLYLGAPRTGFAFIGATVASTGRPGGYEYFETPLGVFEHSVANPDFRAEGTRNANGILGYGVAGMRVFDFGWQLAERGWGRGGMSPMRLQMHATDPQLLEVRLGRRESKGCIRIPATLNQFIDRYGLLDADYERALAHGARLWMLRADRVPTPMAGRYLVVVDSGTERRPEWAMHASAPLSSVTP